MLYRNSMVPDGWDRRYRVIVGATYGADVGPACDNCGRDDDDLAAVRRVYLLPEPSTLDEIEQWCVSCRTQYPHEDAGD